MNPEEELDAWLKTQSKEFQAFLTNALEDDGWVILTDLRENDFKQFSAVVKEFWRDYTFLRLGHD